MATSITKPRASVIFPAADTPRGVPTIGAIAINRPCTSSTVSPTSADGSTFNTYDAAGASIATSAASRASMCSRASRVPRATDTAVISARVLSTGWSSGTVHLLSCDLGWTRTAVVQPRQSCQHLTARYHPLGKCVRCVAARLLTVAGLSECYGVSRELKDKSNDPIGSPSCLNPRDGLDSRLVHCLEPRGHHLAILVRDGADRIV